MKLLMVLAAIWFSIGTTNSLTYPIFGTKRYNRGLPSQRSDMTQNIMKQPAYEHGYLTNNGYYYYPHHEYHSYGMPTYRGEYKPKAYYYSSGPSYNYYNDREPLSNPLDDLHEEILQENEQERQTDLLQRDDYDDDYYIDPNEKIHDAETTNNFLRNMMEYNRQKEKQQRLQQLHYRQRDQLDQEAHNEMAKDVHSAADDDYFSEVNPDDYQFEPQGEDNFDLQKYWDAELLSMNKGAPSADVHYRGEPELTRLNNDQDVEELKTLSKHEPENYDEDSKKRYNKAKLPQLNSWSHPKSSDTNFPQQKDFEDDYAPIDYDDGSWINWDRKRSSFPDKKHGLKVIKLKTEIESHKPASSTSQNKQSFFSNESPESTSIRSATLPSIAYGQKEKYPMEESNAAIVLDQKNEENSNKKLSKSTMGIENTIYDTIKKMITIEQKLKKKRSKMQKRNKNDGGSVVNQLNSLKKHTN